MSELVLQAGPSHDDNEVFATWHSNQQQDTFDLPDKYQTLDQIYVQINQAVNGDSSACVKWNGVPKQAVKQTKKGNEHHDIKVSDKEDHCDC